MQMMESLQETAQGIRIVKAFTLENFMRDRQDAGDRQASRLAPTSSRASARARARSWRAWAASPSPPSSSIRGYTVIIRGNPPGSLFSFITSVIMLYEPMKRVARLHVDLSSSLFGVSMLYSFLDERDYEEDAPAGARA